MLAAVLVGATPSCSLLFVSPPPASPEDLSPIVRCTSSDALPIVDMLLTGAVAAPAVFAAAGTDAEYAGGVFPRDLDIIVGAGLTALFFVSTVMGFRDTSKCRELMANSDEPDRNPRLRRSPPRLKVGPARALPSAKRLNEPEAAQPARDADTGASPSRRAADPE